MTSREYYQKHKSDPGFRERQRQSLRASRARRKDTPEFKKQKAEHDLRYKLKVRDSEEFREKRNVFNLKYRSDPSINQVCRESVRKWVNRNPEKSRAHQAVRYAISTGKLVRPKTCSKCGNVPTLRRDGRSGFHAHHQDYSKPLQVEWLCAFCHGNERRKV